MAADDKLETLVQRTLSDTGLPSSTPTRSRWQDPPREYFEQVSPTKLPEHTDAVIIGSGVTGCSVAYHMLEKGGTDISLTVLEAREICSGATGRNGGRISCTAVQDFDKYKQIFGSEAAEEIVRFEISHLEELRQFAGAIGQSTLEDVEFRSVTSVGIAFSEAVYMDLSRMLVAFEEAFPDLRGKYCIISKEDVEKVTIVLVCKPSILILARDIKFQIHLGLSPMKLVRCGVTD